VGAQKVEGTDLSVQRRAVFLDRDGVLIQDVGYLSRPDQVRVLGGVPAALRRLREAGFLLLVVTNQSAIARGWLTEDDLATIHDMLNKELAGAGAGIDAFYYCPHLPDGEVAAYARTCECRKPAPGMILEAARQWGVVLDRSYVIGDSARDVEAGRRAGCRTILVGSGPTCEADACARDLAEAADRVLRWEDPENGDA